MGWQDFLPDIVLTEAKDDDATTDVNSTSDASGNKDIEADTKDAKSDSTDVEDDTTDSTSTDTDSETTDDTTDDAQPSPTDDTSDDSSTVASPSNAPTPNNKEKKLYLYQSLREIKSSFEAVLGLLESLITSDLPDANLDTLKLLRTKVINNLDLLKDLLSNTNIAKSKTYEDLQIIHNIYVSDLKITDANLASFSRLLKSRAK